MNKFNTLLLLLAVAAACLSSAKAFSPSSSQHRAFTPVRSATSVIRGGPGFKHQQSSSSLFSTEQNDTETESPVATQSESSPTADYPLNVPSPLLLAASMVLGITGTGSVFELTGGSPNLGFAPTAAIAAVSVPLCFFLFYASVKKAQAETEEDDKEFLKRNGGRF